MSVVIIYIAGHTGGTGSSNRRAPETGNTISGPQVHSLPPPSGALGRAGEAYRAHPLFPVVDYISTSVKQCQHALSVLDSRTKKLEQGITAVK